jgi:parallel beta-helix repeat protein
MTTNYPGAIDGYAEIRVARNRIDEIVAEDHNDLRSAVIAIEQTLGVNPQGPFGTVKARMDDAYQNIESHVLGNPPRHQDTVLESPARSGLYHSLTQGTVGSQIVELLEDINGINYPGSGGRTFADGYALPSSYLRSAVSEIVGQIGSPSGINKIGATSFNPGSSGQYTFFGTDANIQMKEAGAYLEEAGRFRARAFDAFVASGMLVVDAGSHNLDINDGHMAANGRLVWFPGAVLSPNPGLGSTQYVYATVTAGAVVVAATPDPAVATSNQIDTTVLLAVLEDAGATWAVIDVRRFGMLSNNKHGFTVGNAIDSKDGYAYDFNSLHAAMVHISALYQGGMKHAPQKITVVTDITETLTVEISSFLSGLEIDGGGHFVTLGANVPLFDISAHAVHIHDLKVLGDFGTTNNMAFADVAIHNDITGLVVTDCAMSSSPSFGVPYPSYFLRIGDAGGTYSLSSALISNNLARVRESAIHLNKPSGIPGTVINNAVITGNIFMNMQTGGGFSSAACIRVGRNCVVTDNVIDVNSVLAPFEGAFIIGIEVEYGESCVIANNVINGGTSEGGVPGAAIMEQGIVMRVSGGGNFTRSIICNNIIKGVIIHGIDCASAGSAADLLICNNFITNRHDWTPTVAANFVGIFASGDPMYVIGNIIEHPGLYGMVDVVYAVGNVIYGKLTHGGMIAAIDLPTGSGHGRIIDSNLIFECSGIGIRCDAIIASVISNNIMAGDVGISTNGIDGPGSGCNITNNIIRNYNGTAISAAGSVHKLLINGNRIFGNSGFGIALDQSESCIIVNNYMEAAPTGGEAAIINFAHTSLVANNFIKSYGGGGYYGIDTSAPAANVMISNNVITALHVNTSGAINVASGSTGASVVGNLIAAVPYVGINMGNSDDSVCSNNILDGDGSSARSGITNVGSRAVVIGNVIREYCSSTSDEAIQCYLGADDVVVVDNVIHLCNGVGIDMNGGVSGGERLLVSNNFLHGAASSGHGIIGINNQSIIANNAIINYGGLAGSTGIRTDTSSGKCQILGNYINPRPGMDVGIDLTYDVFYLVANNVIGNVWNGVNKAGIDVNSGSRNFIIGNIVAGSNSGVSGDDGIKDVGGANVVCNNIVTVASYDGISVSGDQCIISGNRIYNAYNDGISMKGGAEYNLINGNHVYWSPMGGRFGIYLDSAANNSVCANYVSQSSSVGIYTDNAIYTLISGNYVYNVGNRGIYSYGSPSSNIVGNLVSTTSQEGIEMYTSNFTQINSNQVVNAGGSGIRTTGNQIHVVGNYVYQCGDNGISCVSGYGGNVSANYIWWNGTGGGYGILVFGLSGYAVIGNTVEGHSFTAFDFSTSTNFIASGNSNFNPGTGTNVHGMNLASTSNGLIVGNLCWGGSGTGSKGFSLPGSVTNTMSGNLSRNGGGGNPRSWGTTHIEDVDNRYIV